MKWLTSCQLIQNSKVANFNGFKKSRKQQFDEDLFRIQLPFPEKIAHPSYVVCTNGH